MLDLERFDQLCRNVKAYTSAPLPPVDPPQRNSIISDSSRQVDAKERLVRQRVGSVYYKDPSKQRRSVFRSKSKKDALADTAGWTFNKAELFEALQQVIQESGHVETALAILTMEPDNPLDINIAYTLCQDGSAVATSTTTNWLEMVAARDDEDFVRLLCTYGASQDSKNTALGVALQANALRAVLELFRSDADPNAPGLPELFISAASKLDKNLVRYFLSSRVPLHQEHLSQALLQTVGRDTDLVALLIAHGADPTYHRGEVLCSAIQQGLLQETAMLLQALVGPKEHLQSELVKLTIENGMLQACRVEDVNIKSRFLDLLLNVGADENVPQLQNQLLDAVQGRRELLVKLLIDHGVSANSNNAESLRFAVSQGDLRLIQVLLRGSIVDANISLALEEAGNIEDAEIYEEIVRTLVDQGVNQQALARSLLTAVQRGSDSIVSILIEKGAHLNYADGESLRIALSQLNYALFRQLLKAPCDAKILGKILPDAMAVKSSSQRYEIVTELLSKGASGNSLDIALQTLVGQASYPQDIRLVKALIESGASVDFVNEDGNCIRTAATTGNDRVMHILCEASPHADTVSNAIGALSVAFADAEAEDYGNQVELITLFLEKGAHGRPVAELLVDAARNDHREKALDVLLAHGADANWKDGAAIGEALSSPRISPLQKICRYSSIREVTFGTQLLTALQSLQFSMEKLALLSKTASQYGYDGVLDMPLRVEVEQLGAREDVVQLLLSLHADVNFENGATLRYAVHHQKLRICKMLLAGSPKPATSSVASAFSETGQIEDKSLRYSMMQALLEVGGVGGPHVGQDDALVQAAREAEDHDLSPIELLLLYGASPDHKDGAAVVAAIQTKNLKLLQRFTEMQPSAKTLVKGFTTVRGLNCDRDLKYSMFNTLLEAGLSGDMTSEALIEAVHTNPTDVEMATLLLKNGASVDFQQGRALCIVAAHGALDTLNLLLSQKPSSVTRDAAFQAATASDLDSVLQCQVYQCLMQLGISQDLINMRLVNATEMSEADHVLLELLLKFHASLDYDDGYALFLIVSRGNLSTLRLLLQASVSTSTTLDRSFARAMAITLKADRLEIAKALFAKEPGVDKGAMSRHLAQVVSENDYELLRLMMEHEADPSYEQGESLVLAVQKGDHESTAILLTSQVPDDVVNLAFQKLLDDRVIQTRGDGGLKTATLLLDREISQDLRDQALLDAFDDPFGIVTKSFVDLLILKEANFNGGDGKAFVATAAAGDVDFFTKLAGQDADLNIVIPALIESHEDENTLIKFLTILEAHTGKVDTPLQDFVTFRALDKFPKGVSLISFLLSHGCSVNSKTQMVISLEPYDFPEGTPEETPEGEEARDSDVDQDTDVADHDKHVNGGGNEWEDINDVMEGEEASEDGEQGADHVPEQVTLLIWTLIHPESPISDDVILKILEQGGAVEQSFETPLTHISATIAASFHGRDAVLQRLFEIGADPARRDSQGRTALFYASQNGHLETARLLVKAGARPDDGSLHEAAREAHSSMVQLLLEEGHRADFPSSLHTDGMSGLTALEELCLHGYAEDDEWSERAYQTIKLLCPADGTAINKSGGKTMLHLAFHNEESSAVILRELLRFPAVWENLDHPIHLFRDDQGFSFSPTIYVEKFCVEATAEARADLCELLRARKCRDRYYAHTVEQPANAIGLPEEIQAAVDKQKREEFELREETRRRDELAAHQHDIDNEAYRKQIARDKERHDLLTSQLREQEATEQQLAKRRQDTAVGHARELAHEKQSAVEHESRMRMQAIQQEADLSKSYADRERSAALAQARALVQEEASWYQSKLHYEKQAMDARYAGAEKEYNLQSHLLQKQEESARNQAQITRQAYQHH